MKLFSILFLMFTVILGGCTHVQSELFVVDHAIVADLEVHQLTAKQQEQTILNKDFVITGHRIVEGSGTVIAKREYARGSFLQSDQSSFRKLTIYFPYSITEKNKRIELDNNNEIIVFFSSGSSNFPGKTGCFGYAREGYIHFKGYSSENMQVELSLNFNLLSPSGWQDECGRFNIRETSTLPRKELSSLSPWEGAEGSNLYEESMNE